MPMDVTNALEFSVKRNRETVSTYVRLQCLLNLLCQYMRHQPCTRETHKQQPGQSRSVPSTLRSIQARSQGEDICALASFMSN